MNQADDAGRGAPKRTIPVIAKSVPTQKTSNAVTPPATLSTPPSPPKPEKLQPQSPLAPAKAEKSLGAVLFDDEPPKSAGAPPLAAGSSKATENANVASSLWPGNVPALSESEKIVAGKAAPPATAEKLTQDFLAALSPVERSAFNHNDNPALKKLRMAIAGRWRLSVALATKPSEQPQINTAALDQMLSEVDVLLSALSAEEPGVDPQIKLAFDSARGALAKNAVDIAEIAFKAHQASAQGAANTAAQKYQKISARIISNSSLEAQPVSRRSKALIGILVASVLGAAMFHSLHFLAPTAPAISTIEGAPPETYGTPLQNSGGMSMVQNLSGKPLTESEMLKFRERMESQGKGVKDMGNGLMFVMPKESSLLAAPNPSASGAPKQ